ncbi:phage tail tape measure protein [Fluviispira vulneris]|uniref:phage tail tape measure protein n=1 Tax=Fluviispira vulneris TaxID=2763012 RepID=UPI001646BA86|nr:phage tail tape measure protein [Fluviispira vulneris]
MTVIQDLQIQIDFKINDKHLKNLQKLLHNVKVEAKSLGISADDVNKKMASSAKEFIKTIGIQKTQIDNLKTLLKQKALSININNREIKTENKKSDVIDKNIEKKKKELDLNKQINTTQTSNQKNIVPKNSNKKPVPDKHKQEIQQVYKNVTIKNPNINIDEVVKNINAKKSNQNIHSVSLGKSSNLNQNIPNYSANLNDAINKYKVLIKQAEDYKKLTASDKYKKEFAANAPKLNTNNINNAAICMGNVYKITKDATQAWDQYKAALAQGLKFKSFDEFRQLDKMYRDMHRDGLKFGSFTDFNTHIDMYKDLISQGAKFNSFKDYASIALKQEKKDQDAINTSLIKKELLLKRNAELAEKLGQKLNVNNNSQKNAINNTNESLSKLAVKSKAAGANINSFTDHMRMLTSQILFVNPAFLSAAFAVQGFGQLFKSLAASVNSSTNSMAKSISTLKAVTVVLTGAIVAAGSAVGYLAFSTAKYAEEVHKNAEIIGMATDEYQRLAYAAKISGINQQEMASSLGSLFQTLKDSKDGKLSETQEQFKKLGIALKDSHGQSRKVSDILSDVSDRFAKIESPIKRAALASALFGDSGRKMLPFLREGSAHLRALGDEAQRSGNVLSDNQIKRLTEMNENFRRLTSMLNGLKLSIGMVLLPFMNKLILRITDWYEKNEALIRQGIEKFFKGVTDGLEIFVQIISTSYRILTGFIKILDDMGISLNTLALILGLFATWKIFGVLGNIILGKGGKVGVFGKIGQSLGKLKSKFVGFFAYLLKFGRVLMRVFGGRGLGGAFRLIARAIAGLVGLIGGWAVLIGAALVGVFLLIDDFLVWMRGGDSLLGRMFGDYKAVEKKVLEFLGNVKQYFIEMWDSVCKYFNTNVFNPISEHGLVGIFEAINNMINTFVEYFKKIGIKFDEMLGYVERKIEEFFSYLIKNAPIWFAKFWDGFKDICSKTIEFLKPYILKFIDWFIYKTWAGLKHVGKNFWDWSKNLFGFDNELGETKGKILYENSVEELDSKNLKNKNKTIGSASFNNSLIPNFTPNTQTKNDTKNITYSISSPINVNVSSQSNPQEIASAMNKNLNEFWNSQMRAAKQNIYGAT